jgi:hypothetical protein
VCGQRRSRERAGVHRVPTHGADCAALWADEAAGGGEGVSAVVGVARDFAHAHLSESLASRTAARGPRHCKIERARGVSAGHRDQGMVYLYARAVFVVVLISVARAGDFWRERSFSTRETCPFGDPTSRPHPLTSWFGRAASALAGSSGRPPPRAMAHWKVRAPPAAPARPGAGQPPTLTAPRCCTWPHKPQRRAPSGSGARTGRLPIL